MGLRASIHVTFWKNTKVAETLDILLSTGWRYDHFGEIFYSPPSSGDDGAPDWAPLEAWPSVYACLTQDIAAGERVGVRLYSEDGNGGGMFWFSTDELMVVVGADGPRIPGSAGLSDITWFLSRLVCPLISGGFKIRSVDTTDGY